jgi:hypothetical protein
MRKSYRAFRKAASAAAEAKRREANAPYTEEEKRSPARGGSIEADVWVPAGQALLIGLGFGVFGLVSVGMLSAWKRWPWWTAAGSGGALFALGFSISVIAFVIDHRRLLWKWELLAQVDLDQDGVIGPPQESEVEEPEYVYVRDPRREKRRRAADDFRFFLRQAYGDRGTTWGAWNDVRLPSGRAMTQSLWETYCERLIKVGLAIRPYSTAPLELASDYRDALEVFRESL